MSQPSPLNQQLLVTAIGPDPQELSLLLCRACQDSRCGIVSSRLSRHGTLSAMTLQASGSWDALARLEVSLDSIASRDDIQLSRARTQEPGSSAQALPYIVYISALYQPDTLAELCLFFARHQVGINSISYDNIVAPQTDTPLLNATIMVTLPAHTQINWLRDHFLEFADHLNLDALIEPWRPQPL